MIGRMTHHPNHFVGLVSKSNPITMVDNVHCDTTYNLVNYISERVANAQIVPAFWEFRFFYFLLLQLFFFILLCTASLCFGFWASLLSSKEQYIGFILELDRSFWAIINQNLFLAFIRIGNFICVF